MNRTYFPAEIGKYLEKKSKLAKSTQKLTNLGKFSSKQQKNLDPLCETFEKWPEPISHFHFGVMRENCGKGGGIVEKLQKLQENCRSCWKIAEIAEKSRIPISLLPQSKPRKLRNHPIVRGKVPPGMRKKATEHRAGPRPEGRRGEVLYRRKKQ